MGRKKKTGLIFSVILALYAVIGFFIIPAAVKHIALKKINESLKRKVEIEKVGLNPFAFSFKIENFKIYTKDEKNVFLGFEKFYANLNLTSSVFRLSPVVSEVYLKSFEGYAEKLENNKFSFSDLMAGENTQEEKNNEPEEDGKEKNFGFAVTDIKIENSGLVFYDKPFNVRHEIKNLNVSIPYISGFTDDSEVPVHIYLSAEANNAQINLDAETKLFSPSLESKAGLKIKDVSLPFYYSYIKDFVNFIPESGTSGLDLNAGFKKEKTENILEAEAKFSLENFLITDTEKSKIASINKILIETKKILPLQNIYPVKNILIDSLELALVRKNNSFNVLELVKNKSGSDSESVSDKAGKSTEPQESDSELNSKKAEEKSSDNKSVFSLNIDEFLLSKGSISFADYDAPGTKTELYEKKVENSISDLNIKVNGFTTAENSASDFRIDFKLNEKTLFNSSGKFQINPVFAEFDASFDKLYFEYANGYIPTDLKILIKKGFTDLKSSTSLKMENNQFKLNSKADLAAGDLNIIERKSKKDFFKLDNFQIKKLDFSLLPMGLDIEEIAVSGINQKIIKNKNNKFNFEEVFPSKSEEPPKEENINEPDKKEKSEVFPVNIKKITLKDIGADYTDFTLSPYFSTNFIINTCTVQNLSSTAFEGADLNLDGKIDTSAPISAKGRLNPLLEELLVDLKIDLRGLDLTHFTPYSGKFIGRAVQKGQLNLDLDYDIKNRKIDAKNKALLDQFEFGRKIESEDAVSLPVGLAVSLLKDRKGEINLDIPVSGSFDDPEFKISKVIFQVLKNLVVKAAASPFSLVASIAGGGEEMRYIEFSEGLSEFEDESLKRLEAVEKILFERPALKLDVKGYCSLEKDRDALKNKNFEIMVENQKTAMGFEKSAELENKDRLKALNKIHESVFDEKFVSELDINQEISLLSEKIKNSIEITDEDLRYLAARRAGKVKDYILNLGRIDTSRIFVNETDKISSPEVKGISGSRAELDLQ
jgi:hypothetical protein